MVTALPPAVLRLIDLALEEDLGRGDVTSEAIFSMDQLARAYIQAKTPLWISGLDVACAVFARVDGREMTWISTAPGIEPRLSGAQEVIRGTRKWRRR